MHFVYVAYSTLIIMFVFFLKKVIYLPKLLVVNDFHDDDCQFVIKF